MTVISTGKKNKNDALASLLNTTNDPVAAGGGGATFDMWYCIKGLVLLYTFLMSVWFWKWYAETENKSLVELAETIKLQANKLKTLRTRVHSERENFIDRLGTAGDILSSEQIDSLVTELTEKDRLIEELRAKTSENNSNRNIDILDKEFQTLETKIVDEILTETNDNNKLDIANLDLTRLKNKLDEDTHALERLRGQVQEQLDDFCESCSFNHLGLFTTCGKRKIFLMKRHRTPEDHAKVAIMKWDPNCKNEKQGKKS